MKTLDILIKVLLVTLMLLSVIRMFFYPSTLEHFAVCWFLLMSSGVGTLAYYKQSIKWNLNK
jgi:hypothetical protein